MVDLKINMNNMEEVAESLNSKTLRVCVIGIGRIGLPTALSFAKSGLQTIGVDINENLVQNINSEKIVEIKDKGKSMTLGGRYHQTKEGGSYHTDSPHWTKVPDLVGMLCINQAKKGGISKFVSAYTIHNQLLKEQNDILKTLYEKFRFDKRGEFKINESQTIFEPVFVFNNDKIHCRFLID